jgi:MFS family permease
MRSFSTAHLPSGRERVNAGPRPGDPPKRGFRAARSSLEHQQYRRRFTSHFTFFLAMSGQGLVRAWLAFELTDSELALGLVSFTVAVPMLLLAPIGGVLSDRWERRNLVVAGQSLVIASEATILTLLLTDSLAFWHLLLGAGVMGCVFPFIMPARQALVVNVVGKRGLPNAMALGMAGMNVTRVAGPALAGFLIGPLGTKGTYLVGASLYIFALLAMLRVHRHPPVAKPNVTMYASVVDGVSYVRENRLVLILIFFGLVPMFLAMPFQTLMVVFAEEVWDVGPAGLGLLSATAGIGGVAGSFYVAWRADSQHRVRSMMVSMIGFGAFLLAFSITPWFYSALALIFVANAFASVYSTLNNTAIQMIIPDDVRGRISSFLMMSFSLPLLGTLPMSAIAEAVGAPTAVGGASLLAVVVALLFYVGSPTLRSMDAGVRAAVAADDRAEAEAAAAKR